MCSIYSFTLVYWPIRQYIGQIIGQGDFAMSKTVRNATLESAAKRATLKPSGKPYWKSIDAGLHLGYRKGTTKGSSGKWVLRRYLGGEQYRVETIAIADDHSKADGADILDFFQAQRRARLRRRPRRPLEAASLPSPTQ
jgi:hypothetical protein